VEGLIPFFIGMNARFYYNRGSYKADIEVGRSTQISQRFFVDTEVRAIMASKTVLNDRIGHGC
jgi:hypothetical protein